jgi:hypothetical protein
MVANTVMAVLPTLVLVPGCQYSDDSVGKEADSGNECCQPKF